MKGYRKILIAVDGSMEVLKQGLALAYDEKCWVTVLKVLPPYEGDIDLTGIKNISDVLNSCSSEAVSMIEDTVRAEGALAKIRVEKGDISETISQVASEEGCDLIMIGARKGGGFFRRFFVYNIINKVINHAPCPVLVVNA
jgi:nucleotide-binding universal stress UspA family protein